LKSDELAQMRFALASARAFGNRVADRTGESPPCFPPETEPLDFAKTNGLNSEHKTSTRKNFLL
jgi:hypothetical protein